MHLEGSVMEETQRQLDVFFIESFSKKKKKRWTLSEVGVKTFAHKQHSSRSNLLQMFPYVPNVISQKFGA